MSLFLAAHRPPAACSLSSLTARRALSTFGCPFPGVALSRLALQVAALLLGLLCLAGRTQAQTLSTLSVAPAGPTGGNTATGLVTLSAAAPANGLTVGLTSTLPSVASVPPTVTVPSGQTQAYFTVTTTAVTADTPLTLSASSGGTTLTAAMTVYAPQVVDFWVTPDFLIGGGPVTGTLFLDGPAPVGGWNVVITSSNTLAAVPCDQDTPHVSIIVPAGATSVNFNIRTSTVNYPVIVTLSEPNSGISADIELLPNNLHVTGLQPPNIVQLAWGAQSTTHYYLYRAVYPPTSPSSWTQIAVLDSSALTYNDAFNFVPGTPYIYALDGDMGVRYSADITEPYFVPTSGNQAVDSRLDLRYSTNVFVDHAFGGSTFRGGLFAGFANDPSRVGRSFVKFPLDTQPTPTLPFFRIGNVAAWLTKAYTTGGNMVAMQIACQAVSNNSWDPTALKWSTAPAVDPTAAQSFATVQYDPTAPVSQWLEWSMGDAMKAALLNQTPLSVALTGSSDSTYGWAYFAKKEYSSALAPTACYAWCGPVVLSLTLSPATIAPGGTAIATVNLNGVGPGDSATVYIWRDAVVNGSPVLSLPTTITVTGLNRTFAIPASMTSPAGQVWIHASLFPPGTYPDSTYFYWYASAQLTVSTTGGGSGPGGGGSSGGSSGPPSGSGTGGGPGGP